MNPYLVLNVPENADDTAIRSAYLQCVKEATPDTDPERFQTYTQAYELIKTESARYEMQYISPKAKGKTPLDSMRHVWRSLPRSKPMPFDAMKEHFRESAKP